MRNFTRPAPYCSAIGPLGNFSSLPSAVLVPFITTVISGPLAVFATSFNFSEAANHNQEQFLATSDPVLVAALYAVFDGFFAMSPTSLSEEIARRNEFLKQGGEDELGIDSQYKHVDEEAARSRKKSK